jgi:hypothetical protein
MPVQGVESAPNLAKNAFTQVIDGPSSLGDESLGSALPSQRASRAALFRGYRGGGDLGEAVLRALPKQTYCSDSSEVGGGSGGRPEEGA